MTLQSLFCNGNLIKHFWDGLSDLPNLREAEVVERVFGMVVTVTKTPMLVEQLSRIGDGLVPVPSSVGEKHLIGDLEQFVGLEPKTIRFYERAGLLAPQRLGRFRVYGHDDIQRLVLIKYLRGIGVPLSKIRHIVATGKSEADAVKVDAELHKLLKEQLVELRRKQVELQDSIDTLTKLLPGQGSKDA